MDFSIISMFEYYFSYSKNMLIVLFLNKLGNYLFFNLDLIINFIIRIKYNII